MTVEDCRSRPKKELCKAASSVDLAIQKLWKQRAECTLQLCATRKNLDG